MKFYKFDYKGPTGIQMITVPTDSDFGLGIKTHDDVDAYVVKDGETELSALTSLNDYRIYKVASGEEPSRKLYTVVLSGDVVRTYQIGVNCVTGSQACVEI